MNRRRSLLQIVHLMLVALLLAACGAPAAVATPVAPTLMPTPTHVPPTPTPTPLPPTPTHVPPTPTPTPMPPTVTPTPPAPTYSELLKTYPEGVEPCGTVLFLVGVQPDGSLLLSFDGATIQTLATNPGIRCYGTKITVKEPVTLEGKTYEPGAKLTVDKDLQWIVVASWD